jgi:hypothetical protein
VVKTIAAHILRLRFSDQKRNDSRDDSYVQGDELQATAEFQAADQRNSKPVLFAAGRERTAPAMARQRFEAAAALQFSEQFFLPIVLGS